jgi:acyl carrier protein
MTTIEKLQAIIEKNYAVARDRLVPEATLEDLGIDSMSTIDLLFVVEDEFGITVGREPIELKTLGDVVAYIDRQVTEQCTTGGA